jgi:hypothetical protein
VKWETKNETKPGQGTLKVVFRSGDSGRDIMDAVDARGVGRGVADCDAAHACRAGGADAVDPVLERYGAVARHRPAAREPSQRPLVQVGAGLGAHGVLGGDHALERVGEPGEPEDELRLAAMRPRDQREPDAPGRGAQELGGALGEREAAARERGEVPLGAQRGQVDGRLVRQRHAARERERGERPADDVGHGPPAPPPLGRSLAAGTRHRRLREAGTQRLVAQSRGVGEHALEFAEHGVEHA